MSIEEKINNLDQEINEIDSKTKSLYKILSEKKKEYNKDKILIINNEILKLYELQIDIIDKRNFLINQTKIKLTDNIIDLYIDKEHSEAFSSNIYLHDTDVLIGIIEYRGETNYCFGDIGYTIKEQYRGHNYAFRALKLIEKEIFKNKNKITITTNIDNIASIKTIERYGGVLISKENNILYYEYIKK